MAFHRFHPALPLAALLPCCAPPAAAAIATDTFQVSATIENGCAFGSQIQGGGTAFDLGTLDFGSLNSTGTAIDAVSSADAGSIVLTCTPGMTLAIALDYGQHAGSASGRHLASGQETLAYQLYQDSAHAKVWGSQADGLAMAISSFPASTTTYTVYGRLLAVDALPSAGVYRDVVTVTLSY